MSKQKTKEELKVHKEEVLDKISTYIDKLIASNNNKIQNKADKFSYWLKDYITFLDFETEFKADKMRKYKRGEILKVHLGYNIGSEEGGLHYCVVLDKENSLYSPVVTIVPLTSVKPWTDINKLHKGEVYLGNDLFTNLVSKINLCNENIDNDLAKLEINVETLKDTQAKYEKTRFIELVNEFSNKIEAIKKSQQLIKQMKKEVLKMKTGSIALTNQITTISKIRIYDPKKNEDVLSNIKLSNEKLDLLDEQIGINYTNLMKNVK
ncbi:MAG: type II toxin-antitoxin system PemK/MazF family toxin [Lachnotalea sp.]